MILASCCSWCDVSRKGIIKHLCIFAPFLVGEIILSDRKGNKIFDIWFNSYSFIFPCQFFVAFRNSSEIWLFSSHASNKKVLAFFLKEPVTRKHLTFNPVSLLAQEDFVKLYPTLVVHMLLTETVINWNSPADVRVKRCPLCSMYWKINSPKLIRERSIQAL